MRTEPLIFELSKSGRQGVSMPPLDVPEAELPADLCRDSLPLPEVSEVESPSGVQFHVRVPARSKENANALCAAIKSAGGGCYVRGA